MTVQDFAQNNQYEIICNQEKAACCEITGVYLCDLLSLAMAGVEDGNIWVTVHTNLNVAAVAVLTNAACVIIPESIPIEEQTIQKAREEGVILIRAAHSAYEISIRYFVQSGGTLT